mmetsp:Transcript_4155/g.16685  ORF Transcript_4155/g.16685 Transcript_4155/m.16685 type:complete len:275 (-) Transcript_4155:294-1118(-)
MSFTPALSEMYTTTPRGMSESAICTAAGNSPPELFRRSITKARAPCSRSSASAASKLGALFELKVDRLMYPTRSPLLVVTSGPHSAERTGSSVMTCRSTDTSISFPPAGFRTRTLTVEPGAPCRACAISYRLSPAVGCPPMAVIRSPDSMPARAAGPPATGATTVSTPSPAVFPPTIFACVFATSPDPASSPASPCCTSSSLNVTSSPTPLTDPVLPLMMVAYASGVRKRVKGSPSCASILRMASYVCSRVAGGDLSASCLYWNQLTPLKVLST